MKSSNNVFHADEAMTILQEWSPVEFEQQDLLTNDVIQSSAARFFGMNSGIKKEQNKPETRNLLKVGKTGYSFNQWQPGEMTGQVINQSKQEPLPWSPFLEQPNPRKMAEKQIEEAKIKAAEIIATANETAEQIRQEAYNQGLENAKVEMQETLQAANSVINVAREWRSDMMSQAEPMIMDLVNKMAEKMFGDGLVLDNATLQQHFASVLESARSLGDLRVYLNPSDARTLGPDWREYQASVLGHQVEIVSNDSIKRGGCYIQGEWGTADSLVETQLSAILGQFSEVGQPEKGED